MDIQRILRSIISTNRDLGNFETSPLRFKYEAIIQEYRSVIDEIRLYEDKLHGLTNYSLTMLGVTFAAWQVFFVPASSNFTALLPIISIVYAVFTIMAAEYTTAPAFLGRYIHDVLRPQLEDILIQVGFDDPTVWQWEEIHVKWMHRTFPNNLVQAIRGVTQYCITYGPAMAALLLYFAYRQENLDIRPIEKISVYLAVIFLILATIAMIHSFFQYKYVGRSPNRSLRKRV